MAGPYVSAGAGNWTVGATWVGEAVPPEPIDGVVRLLHAVTLDEGRTMAAGTYISIEAGGVLTCASSLDLSGAGGTPLYMSAASSMSVSNGATLTVSGVTVDIDSGCTLTMDTGSTLTTNSSTTWALDGTLDLNAVATTPDGTFTGAGSILCSGSLTVAATAVFTAFTNGITFDQTTAAVFTLTTNAIAMPSITVNNNAGITSFTFADDVTFQAGANAVRTAGKSTCGSRTFTFAAGAHNFSWNAGQASGQYPGNVVVNAGATVTKTATCDVAGLNVAAGGTMDGASTLTAVYPTNSVIVNGTVSGAGGLRIMVNAAYDTGGNLLLATSLYIFCVTNSAVVTVGGRLTATAGYIYALTTAKVAKLALGGPALFTAAVTLGLTHATSDFSGGLKLNGNSCRAVAGIVTSTGLAVTPTGNTLELDNGYLEIGANLNTASITVTATADNIVHIVGTGASRAVSNFDPNKIVHCHNCSDGGGNDAGVTFNTHAPPGSRSLCGAGV